MERRNSQRVACLDRIHVMDRENFQTVAYVKDISETGIRFQVLDGQPLKRKTRLRLDLPKTLELSKPFLNCQFQTKWWHEDELYEQYQCGGMFSGETEADQQLVEEIVSVYKLDNSFA